MATRVQRTSERRQMREWEEFWVSDIWMFQFKNGRHCLSFYQCWPFCCLGISSSYSFIILTNNLSTISNWTATFFRSHQTAFIFPMGNISLTRNMTHQQSTAQSSPNNCLLLSKDKILSVHEKRKIIVLTKCFKYTPYRK